ncbi:T9SS ring complex lipoprotein PorK/GldK [Bergeyella zoohelcum]|uniref:Gliding motility-associated lipoprotein GldK n=2 Tax=Bergeyella zoohelcum TaxID=1015 RepID=K1LL55_9FLAO|nr:gliding motility lipoprotein GldK [Bergeyella zoohelcum]EKB57505.1 gliding motility-associated lipoprotein GldK [Bergeyella zoohelcum ATCC 43767]EKB60336.1 gliding motility-associated lipoprotein GldK [Bergeyella zoohelcum CCUG 30536]MDY6026259.1 gliding motility lipoprotein GldK [Bergeyella zoohelcum]SUV48825.1 Serine/threonine-protein kinase pkn1 [Bergeyella zoohelcum]SUV52983.1 Serine/threonine-protein kinase pkn1 [Bergeyella zoohelcum]
MKRIFHIVAGASLVAVVSCSGGGRGSAGKPGVRGELIPREKSKSFVAERPYGMVSIPGGSFVVGLADQDLSDTPEKANLKTVTVSSFFMDEAETTNGEYREFIKYVRDSIARTLLAEAAGEGGEEAGNGQSIGDYAYLIREEDEELSPYQEWLESQGGRGDDSGYDPNKKLNWRVPLHWNTNNYPDVEYAEVIESMYIPVAQRYRGERMIDASKLKYSYVWEDHNTAVQENSRYGGFLKRESLAIYPDTTVWVKDFKYTYNEPLFEQYFWHKAYKDYPVVGVTWDQARAYCDFRTKLKSDYNESLKKKKQRPMRFRLPTEVEWEYAAKGGRQNASYPWGGPYLVDDRGCYLANFKPKRGNYVEDEKTGTYTFTAPVKKFRKNDYGLFDMAGNVAEWTDSQYDNSSYQFTNSLNPTTKRNNDTRKSVRGGSWKDIGYMLMTGTRDWERKDSARSYIGFRTVQDIPEGAVKSRRR